MNFLFRNGRTGAEFQWDSVSTDRSSTQTFKRNGKNSVVFKSTTLVRVSERKTKQEKMYARHGKMLAFFSSICYDEITLNSKEKKTCKGTSLQGHREFRGIFRTVENEVLQEEKERFCLKEETETFPARTISTPSGS